MADFNLSLNDDQLALKEWINGFAKDVMRPAAEEWDEREEFPWPVVQEAAKIGLYGIDFMMNAMFDPTGLTMPVAVEELFWGDAGIGLSIMGSGLAAAGISAVGTQEQIMEWVPQCYGTADKVQLGAFCVSEPDAGSDVSSLRTRAVYDEANDEWVLNGTKAWITNGGIADVHVVVAAVDPELKGRGQASFIVPPGTKGLSQGTVHHKLGFRASVTAEVVLDNVVVPGDCLLGGKSALDKRLAKARSGESAGGQAAMATFEGTRWMVAAMGVGLARAAYEYARDYAKEREAFGKKIAEHQQVAEMLADMATKIHLARLGVIDAARTYLTTGKLKRAQGSMVKYFASEMSERVTSDALRGSPTAPSLSWPASDLPTQQTRLRPICLALYKFRSARPTKSRMLSPTTNCATPMEIVICPSDSPDDFLITFLASMARRICSSTSSFRRRRSVVSRSLTSRLSSSNRWLTSWWAAPAVAGP